MISGPNRVNLVLELKLDGLVRCQFPEHSGGTNSPNIESRSLLLEDASPYLWKNPSRNRTPALNDLVPC